VRTGGYGGVPQVVVELKPADEPVVVRSREVEWKRKGEWERGQHHSCRWHVAAQSIRGVQITNAERFRLGWACMVHPPFFGFCLWLIVLQ